jgi:hypothetical protein
MQAVVGLFSACWAQDGRVVELGGVRGEVLAGVAVVADDRLAAAQARSRTTGGRRHALCRRRRQGSPSDRAVRGAQHGLGDAQRDDTARRSQVAPACAHHFSRSHSRWFLGDAGPHSTGVESNSSGITRGRRGAPLPRSRSASIVAPTGPHHHAHPHVRRAARARSGGSGGSAGRGAERDSPLRGLPCTYGVHRSPRVGFGPCWSAAQRTSAARARGVSHTRTASPATPRAGRATISAAVIISPGVPCPALAAPFLMVAGTDRAPPTTIRAP